MAAAVDIFEASGGQGCPGGFRRVKLSGRGVIRPRKDKVFGPHVRRVREASRSRDSVSHRVPHRQSIRQPSWRVEYTTLSRTLTGRNIANASPASLQVSSARFSLVCGGFIVRLRVPEPWTLS